MQASTEKRGATGIIRIDNPPVNAISHGVRTGIMDGLQTLIEDSDISAIVLACEGRTWMAGADITEFGKPMAEPLLTDVVQALDRCPKPVVAALFGTAFGGGLEVALACNYRVATEKARIGLPEVKLGLIPGAGGTQRLPRAGDVDLALNAIVSGNPVPAPVAAASGVIDRIVEGDLVDAAVQLAQERVADGSPLKRLSDVTLDPQQYDAAYFAAFRKSIARRTRGMTAPERGIQAVEAAVNLPFEEGVARERELFMQCHADPQSRAMQHVFFAERQAAKIPGLKKDVTRRPVRQVAVIGAGTMGGGIAMNFANAGIPVSILEISQEALDRGVGIIARNYENSARKGRLSDQQVKERMALITPVVEYERLADADLVIEAVFETMDIKKTVFAELDRVTRDDAILATNTSYLDINEIADGVSHPERVLGMHFFSPANVMRLLEIVRAEKTAPDVLSTVLKLARTIGKVGVVAGVCHGFIGNRMLGGYSREANLLVMEGADPQQVDRVLVDFGMPMGLLAMGDLAGLDVGYRNRQGLDPSQYDARAVYLSDRLVEMDRMGQKTSAGIYDYAEGDRTPIPSPITAKIIEEGRQKFDIKPREISEREIIQRCFYSLFNSGCNVLHEGIAYRASDIDIVYINGYGFPAWRGGPMYWGEHSEGLATILETIQEFASIHGDRWWKPSPLLQRLVEEGGSLGDVVNS